MWPRSSSSGLVDMVVCGEVSTTHAESARNSKPASLRALDACAPIFTNNDDHDDDNKGDHIIGGRRIRMVMIMSLRFLDACSLIFTTDNATIATICRAPLTSFTSSGCPGKYGVRDTMLMKLKVHNLLNRNLRIIMQDSVPKVKEIGR